MRWQIFFLGLFLLLVPFVSSVEVNSGVVVTSSGTGGTITFDIDANVTSIEVELTYIYLGGISYTNGGVSYSCSYNHTASTDLSVTDLCVTSSSSTSVGGSSGTGNTYTVKPSDFVEGYSKLLKKSQGVEVQYANGNSEIVEVVNVDTKNNIVTVLVNEKDYEINLNGNVKIDSDGDGFYDLQISVSEVRFNGYANLEFNLINEEIPSQQEEQKSEGIFEKIPETIKKNSLEFYILLGAVVILGIVWFILRRNKNIIGKR